MPACVWRRALRLVSVIVYVWVECRHVCGGALWGCILLGMKRILTLLALSRCMPWDCTHDTAVARGHVEERVAIVHVYLKCQYACGVVFGGWYAYLAPNLTSPDKGSCEV